MTTRALREPELSPVIDPLHVARTSRERTRGLLDRGSLEDGEGMWFPRCRLVHTFGMKFSIDLVYLTGELEVCKVVRGLGPGRLSACLGAESLIELKCGAAEKLGLSRGVKLRILE